LAEFAAVENLLTPVGSMRVRNSDCY